MLFRQWTTKALIRLRRCAGWSAPLLFAYGINRFSHDVAHINFDVNSSLYIFFILSCAKLWKDNADRKPNVSFIAMNLDILHLQLKMSRRTTKPTKWHVCSAKTQSLHCMLNRQLSFFMRTAVTDKTGWMPRLIWVFPGRTGHFVGIVMRWLKS